MRRPWLPLLAASAALLITAAPTLACGGLIGPNGAVNLLRTTTLRRLPRRRRALRHLVRVRGRRRLVRQHHAAARHPDRRGARRRLDAPAPHSRDRSRRRVRTLLRPPPERVTKRRCCFETTIDALDITILRGGGDEVGLWAKNHGFRLPPDSPEVLDFYADRSPIFMAAAFDADAAAERGQAIGDGTPVHLTIPTDNPWVPLRILGLGKAAGETGRGRRLPADRHQARAAAERRRLRRGRRAHPRPQRRGDRLAARRPALQRRHGVGPRGRVADQGRRRIRCRRSRLRPRDRRLRRREALGNRRGLRAVRAAARHRDLRFRRSSCSPRPGPSACRCC